MKRLLCVTMLILCSILVLTACGSKTLQDGTYRAEKETVDKHGYKDYLVVSVKDGKVESIEFNAVDTYGKLKTDNTDYTAAMKAVAGTDPETANKTLTDAFLSSGDFQKVDIVSGATITSNNFKALLAALETPIKEGKTDTVIVK